jgi:hypothetical protein
MMWFLAERAIKSFALFVVCQRAPLATDQNSGRFHSVRMRGIPLLRVSCLSVSLARNADTRMRPYGVWSSESQI